MTKSVGIGLIGAGFMGRCHANAFRSVAGLFDVPVTPELISLADVTDETARHSAKALGFAEGTGDWRRLIDDPRIGIVAITAPNSLHEEMAIAAIEAGKTVYCEKPLSVTTQSARRMTEAASAAGVVTMVGFNFLRNPMVKLAREIIASGEIGDVTGFRGIHAENYMADPEVPHSFRTDPAGGGALADIGSHIISMVRYLLGPIAEVMAAQATVVPTRPASRGDTRRVRVAVDDRTVLLCRFERGIIGSIEANWAATGRKMQLDFEVTGSKGAIAFTQERMNELLLMKPTARGRDGFARIEAGPEHEPYGRFCPAPGHHLGFNDLKVIEVAELLDAHAGKVKANPDFQEALEVQKVVEAAAMSAARRAYVAVDAI